MYAHEWLDRIKRDPSMRPKDRVHLAQLLLNDQINEGFSYADFMSAQAVQKYVKKASNALKGLPLS